MDTKGSGGSFGRKIVVTTNDPERPRLELLCKGQVLVPIKAEPASVKFPDILRDDPAQEQTVEILRGDDGPIAPVLMPLSSKYIGAELTEIEPGERYALKVTISPPWPNGSLRRFIKLKTGVAHTPETSILVSAKIEPRAMAVPKHVSVRNTDSAFKQSIYLQWAGGPPKNIVKATCNDPKVTVRVKTAGGRQRVVVRIPAGHEPPPRTSYISIQTDDAEAPLLRVPIKYVGKARRSRLSGRSAGKEASAKSKSPATP